MRHRPYECGGHPTLRLDGVWPQGAPAPLFFFFFFGEGPPPPDASVARFFFYLSLSEHLRHSRPPPNPTHLLPPQPGLCKGTAITTAACKRTTCSGTAKYSKVTNQ
jgi:hypothetical protein